MELNPKKVQMSFLREYGFEPENCEIGVPEYTGYSLIGEVNGLNSTAFVDNEVFFGGQYCYMVVTCFPNGAISLASEEFCGFLNKEAPVITNVSVEATDLSNGENGIGIEYFELR